MASDIQIFRKKNPGRNNNDSNNKIRERVLSTLFNVVHAGDPEHGKMWVEISNKFKEILKQLCPVFDDLIIKKKAGRKFNYDFDFTFMNKGIPIHKEFIEFKHNAKSICDLPQYLNLSENIGFMPYHSYAEYFYDTSIPEICRLSSLEIPNKDEYMKFVYQNNYDKLDFFRKLKDKESSIKKEKERIVNNSIREYLNKYSKMLSIPMLNYEIKRSQTKQFLCWNGDFHLDKFSDDEMLIESIHSIKNGNTIIANSKSGQHHLLLRWKNHKGILFPAWQIKLAR